MTPERREHGLDDKHILARARRGELDAFEELVRRYEKRVYVIALRSSGNPEDAAEAAQEAFLATHFACWIGVPEETAGEND